MSDSHDKADKEMEEMIHRRFGTGDAGLLDGTDAISKNAASFHFAAAMKENTGLSPDKATEKKAGRRPSIPFMRKGGKE